MEIKVGKKYLTRDNRVVEITEFDPSDKSYPYSGELWDDVGQIRNITFTKEGNWLLSDSSFHDLVEEYKEEDNRLDFSRPLQTRAGNDVKIYAIDEDDSSGVPVKGAINYSGKRWEVFEWDLNGVHCPKLDDDVRTSAFDLVYNKQTDKVWFFLMKSALLRIGRAMFSTKWWLKS